MGWRYDINLDNIDWELLIEQKKHLLEILNKCLKSDIPHINQKEVEALEGILNILDAIDDKIDAGDYRQTYEK